MSSYLRYAESDDLASFQNRRLSESHVADVILVPDQEMSYLDNLEFAQQRGVEFVIVGIPEDIGPRANCGKGGAKNAWQHHVRLCLHRRQPRPIATPLRIGVCYTRGRLTCSKHWRAHAL